MIKQSVLSFKLETTNDQVTPNAGLALQAEFMTGLKLPEQIDEAFPTPGSAAGYQPSAFSVPIILMLLDGGRCIEDLREIKMDAGLRELLNLESIPSTDAVGDWLRRSGNGGLDGAEEVNRSILHRDLRDDPRQDFTLDIDATSIEAEKKDAKWTYKGFKGYMPIVGHLAENGMIIGDEFREGNDPPAARNLEFIKHCVRQMPKGNRIRYLRADSASYQAKIFNYCEKENIKFAIGADLDVSVKAVIASIPDSDWEEYQNGHIAETVHTMNETDKSFRLIVIRRPKQRDLFGEDCESFRYFAIATNFERKDKKSVVAWYNKRGEASENRIKELKIGLNMEHVPCGRFEANEMWFRLGCIAYNIFVLFKKVALPESWSRFQIQTLRWKLYHVAGKVVHHSNRISLKVRRYIYGLFKDIRLRVAEYCFA